MGKKLKTSKSDSIIILANVRTALDVDRVTFLCIHSVQQACLLIANHSNPAIWFGLKHFFQASQAAGNTSLGGIGSVIEAGTSKAEPCALFVRPCGRKLLFSKAEETYRNTKLVLCAH